jgi:hypothetical protein
MRPDLPDELVLPADSMPEDDMLANSLCQFDILYCVLVAAEGHTTVRSFYPSSAALLQSRADPIVNVIATDAAARAELLPNSDDAYIAGALDRVLRAAEQESRRFGGRWWGPSWPVQNYLDAHLLPQ